MVDAGTELDTEFLSSEENKAAGSGIATLREFTGPHPTIFEAWQWGR